MHQNQRPLITHFHEQHFQLFEEAFLFRLVDQKCPFHSGPGTIHRIGLKEGTCTKGKLGFGIKKITLRIS